MFVYVGKRFDAAQVGACFVGVNCAKCNCEYYYQLSRIGTGSGTAPYMIGQGFAASSAEEQSRRDLENRLKSEAELVPCPKCNWINDELVDGYRCGNYRGFSKAALFGGVLGVAITLVFCWAMSSPRGPQSDRNAAPYFLLGGLILTASYASGLMLVQTLLRRRIRPNRDFPRPPTLPPGTPPALIKDPSSGALIPAMPVDLMKNDGWIDFQIGRHLFPLLCCECLKPATTQHAIAIPLNESLKIEIPRCSSCATRPQSTGGRGGWILFGAIGLLAGGMAFSIWKFDAAVTCAINAALLTLFFAAVALMAYFLKGEPMHGPIESGVVDVSRGVVRLRFRNPEYGILVAKQITDADELESSQSGSAGAGPKDNTQIRAASSSEIERDKADP
jgi:hypothetical protein